MTTSTRGTLVWMALAVAGTCAPATALAHAPDEARNMTIVLAAFERWRQGHPGFFESILAPEARWTIAGFGAGTRSFDDRASFLAEAVAPFAQRLQKPLVPTVRAAWGDGNEVVVHWTGEAVARDGRPYCNTYVWILTMEDGRAVAVTAFLDLAPYNDLLRRIP